MYCLFGGYHIKFWYFYNSLGLLVSKTKGPRGLQLWISTTQPSEPTTRAPPGSPSIPFAFQRSNLSRGGVPSIQFLSTKQTSNYPPTPGANLKMSIPKLPLCFKSDGYCASWTPQGPHTTWISFFFLHTRNPRLQPPVINPPSTSLSFAHRLH